MLAIAAGLLGLLEAGVRVRDRLKFGRWMPTPAEERYMEAQRLLRIVEPHPDLIGVLRAGGESSGRGRSAHINSLGYRGDEIASPKPEGVLRILAIGGSTTFDVCVSSDQATWTHRLEEALARRFPGRRIEVVNGGHPGYTSLEMLRKLQMIDLDRVEPDIVLAFIGLNDLQPSAAPGFRPDYSVGHAEIQRRFLGFESRPPGLLARSLLLHKIRRKLGREEAEVPRTPRRDAPLPEAETVYRERLESIAASAAARGAACVFVTQKLRIGNDAPTSPDDSVSAYRWLPFLTVRGIIAGMDRYNAITRAVADSLSVPLVDVAAGLGVDAADFSDYCHWTDSGASKMGEFVAAALPETLFTRTARRN